MSGSNLSLNPDASPAALRAVCSAPVSSARQATLMHAVASMRPVIRWARRLLSFGAVAILAVGCASAPPGRVVRIPAVTQTDSPSVRITDTRPAQQKQARADPELAQVLYLGDETFEPAPVSLLNRVISTKLKNAADPLVIELVRFDVAVSNSAVRDIYRSSPPTVAVAGAPVGATFVGNVIGRLLLAAFQGAPNQSVVVHIELRLPSGPVEITDYGALYSGRSISDAIQTVLPRALDSLSNRVAEATQIQ
jgi:hypothetical protein